MRVALTGTGTPRPSTSRAGPGVLVESGSTRIQVDAGRATVMRLAALGVDAGELAALCLTHHHSDHTVAVPDIMLTRWILGSDAPLTTIVPDGPLVPFMEGALLPWSSDIEVRAAHAARALPPAPHLVPFEAGEDVVAVARIGDVQVSAVRVRHEPVLPSVAYRFEGPNGAVVVSGDTVACPEVRRLAAGVDVLVHEAMIGSLVPEGRTQFIREYHAECRDVGRLARDARVSTLVLTHLIPEPVSPTDVEQFSKEARAGGFEGDLHVGDDLLSLDLLPGGRVQVQERVVPGAP